MSQKAWMNAYTKGSKSLQARLSKIHANNPEFQDFVKKHGFGGNLSAKQSEKQKTHSVASVKPVDNAQPEAKVGPQDREGMIKAAAEKIKNRRMANANRVAFGGELGGGFQMPASGFRRYSEETINEAGKLADKIRAHPAVEYYGGADDSHFINLKKGWHMGDGQRSFGNQNVKDAWHDLKRVVKFKKGEAKNVYGIDESNMPASIIKTKQKFAEKSPEELRAAFKEVAGRTGKSVEDIARSTARRHGHKNVDTYLNRMKEEWNKTSAERGIKPGEVDTDTFERDKKILAQRKPNVYLNRPSFASGLKKAAANRAKKTDEEVDYKDAKLKMRRSGWVVSRNGKVQSAVLPSQDHAKRFVDDTRMTLGKKLGSLIRKKAKDIARGMGKQSYATESAANRNRIMSPDSAILKDRSSPPFTPDKPKNLDVIVGKRGIGYAKSHMLARKGLADQEKHHSVRDKLARLRAAGHYVQAREIERKALAMGFAKEKELSTENTDMNILKNLRNAIKEGMDPDTWNGKNPKNPLVNLHATKEKKIDGREPMIGHMHLSTAAGIHGLDHAQALLDLRAHGEHVGGDKKVRVSLSQHQKVWEETIVEAGKNPYGSGYKLIDKDGKQLSVGHKFKDEDGEHHEITGWQSGAQRGNSSSSGRVAVKVGKGKNAYHSEYFPHVFDMKVVKEEAVNELKTSTVAAVAQKRYAQAQKALKDKDYGGYVKGMKKAIKAGDATTPKSGWTQEEETKVEVDPIEKYRQIREGKVRNVRKLKEGSWDKEQAERERQAKLPKKDDGDTGLFAGVMPTKKKLSPAQQKAFDKVLPKRK
jgi:hypothetical protein